MKVGVLGSGSCRPGPRFRFREAWAPSYGGNTEPQYPGSSRLARSGEGDVRWDIC
jgi:hypothetical protein